MIRTCSYLKDHRGALLTGLALLFMAASPHPMWGQWTGTNPIVTNSNVGIGTPSPDTKLSVVSSGSIDGLTLSSVNRSSIWFTTTGLYNRNWLLQNAVSSNTDFQFLASATVGGTPTISVMTLLANGNVGIGTANAQYKLAVNGSIGAQDIIVTNTGWPDYVFRSGYRLRPLSEVSKFIQMNGHLPDIPTEAEVKERGVSLGDMQAKLLAKVEELTLHMIRAEQENRELRQQNSDLQQRVARLESK